MRFVLGVDEAGRGPLAGPVAVGVVCVPEGFNVRKKFPEVRDSKKLSAKKREEIFKQLHERAKAGELSFCVRFSSAATIDKRGISRAVAHATARGVRALAPKPGTARVLLDGLLAAPAEYPQRTIVGGDDSVALISLASIAAKVVRDRRMARLAREYPHYHFDIHKGYGTKLHYLLIKKHGPSAIHRHSFLHLEKGREQE